MPFFNFKFFEQFLIYNVNITDYIKSGIIHVLLSLAGLSFAVGTFNIIINNNNIDNFINFYYFTKYSKYIIYSRIEIDRYPIFFYYKYGKIYYFFIYFFIFLFIKVYYLYIF